MIDLLTLGTDKVRYFIQLLLVSFLGQLSSHQPIGIREETLESNNQYKYNTQRCMPSWYSYHAIILAFQSILFLFSLNKIKNKNNGTDSFVWRKRGLN